MKKTLYTSTFFFIVVIFSFLLVNITKASEIIAQDNAIDSMSTASNCGTAHITLNEAYLLDYFIVSFRPQFLYTPPSSDVVIYFKDNSNNVIKQFDYTADYLNGRDWEGYNNYFDPNTTVSAGDYHIVLCQTGDTSYPIWYYIHSYSYNLAYTLYGGSPYIPPSIELSYPIDEATNVANFEYWRASFINNDYYPTLPNVWTIKVNYGTNTNFFEFSDLTTLYSLPSSIEFPASLSFERGSLYYASVELTDFSGTILSKSATSTFTISNESVLYEKIDNSLTFESISTTTTASSTPYALISSCENQNGIISYGSCVLFSFLFTPHEATLKNWEILKNSIIKKPPFGYFTVYQNVINGLTTATTTNAVALADLSSLSTPLFNPLKIILTMILWFLFAWSMFTRLKNLQL